MRQLVVSLDAIAAMRELVGGEAGDLLSAAALADLAGAERVRLTVSEDLRPVGESDLREVRRAARGLELRMAPAPALVKAALEARPERVLLASEPREMRRSAPLDFGSWGGALASVIRTLDEAGIEVAVLVAPTAEAVKAAHAADARAIEFFTGTLVDLPPRERGEALLRLGDASRLAAKLRLRAGVGGRLDARSIRGALESAPVAEWVSVGRHWVGRSLLLGADRATRDLRELIA
jgi:pyridoxine 5-phosphate synthase